MKHPRTTPAFLGPDGTALPNSIAEIERLRLGGLDQWVMTRGESVANPPLILLYGGPGLSETPLFRHFNALAAPAKTVVWFDESGHESFVDEPQKFNRSMAELVRPVVP